MDVVEITARRIGRSEFEIFKMACHYMNPRRMEMFYNAYVQEDFVCDIVEAWCLHRLAQIAKRKRLRGGL